MSFISCAPAMVPMLQVSPDGKSLAYLAPSEDKDVLNVWVRSTNSDNAKMVTKDELRGIRYTGMCKHSPVIRLVVQLPCTMHAAFLPVLL